MASSSVTQLVIACAVLVLAPGCVEVGARATPSTAARADADELRASDALAVGMTAAARAQALGGRPALARWVRREPRTALDIVRSKQGGEIAAQVAAVYEDQQGLTSEQRTHVEDARRCALDARRAKDVRAERDELARAVEACGTARPCHLAFDVGLSLADACKRAGDARAATAAWNDAIAHGMTLADIDGLRNALATRPADASTSIAAMNARIGELELRRGRLDDALRAAQEATRGASAEEKPAIELFLARVKYARKDLDGARALVEPLCDARDERVRRPALALSGVLAGERDDLDLAMTQLSRSLDGDATWTGAGRARADLGVALLRAGREEEGLRALADARAWLLAAGEFESLVRTLRNEAAYERDAGRGERASALSDEAQRVAAANGIVG